MRMCSVCLASHVNWRAFMCVCVCESVYHMSGIRLYIDVCVCVCVCLPYVLHTYPFTCKLMCVCVYEYVLRMCCISINLHVD